MSEQWDRREDDIVEYDGYTWSLHSCQNGSLELFRFEGKLPRKERIFDMARVKFVSRCPDDLSEWHRAIGWTD